MRDIASKPEIAAGHLKPNALSLSDAIILGLASSAPGQMIIGLSLAQDRPKIARALLEGMSFEIRRCLEVFEEEAPLSFATAAAFRPGRVLPTTIPTFIICSLFLPVRSSGFRGASNSVTIA
jgi:hypothetical protein